MQEFNKSITLYLNDLASLDNREIKDTCLDNLGKLIVIQKFIQIIIEVLKKQL